MEDVHILPDVLGHGFRVIFCGTAAGKTSAAKGAYYAGRGNRFWVTLHEVGITPVQFEPVQFNTLTEHGVGLTDIAKRRSGNDTALQGKDFDLDHFRAKLSKYAPLAVAFNGKLAASKFFKCRTTALKYGLQIATSDPRIWVLPSTSGAARAHWDIEPWKALAAWLRRRR